ncbi:MAG: hypothetical protein IJO63_03320 [Bacilli bacterium]|nr:hypothetical protein [Bacilli bacterium]
MKEANEITVEVNTTVENLNEILESNNFKLIEEVDYNDIYMIKNDCSATDCLEILKGCVIIRNIINENIDVKQIVYKQKEYNDKKEIVSQSQVKCQVYSVKEAIEFFEGINYHSLIKINDHIKVYANDEVEFAVQFVNNKHIYIELEQDKDGKRIYKDLESMKNIFKKYNIPIKNNDYFVKKAEVELLETMHN